MPRRFGILCDFGEAVRGVVVVAGIKVGSGYLVLTIDPNDGRVGSASGNRNDCFLRRLIELIRLTAIGENLSLGFQPGVDRSAIRAELFAMLFEAFARRFERIGQAVVILDVVAVARFGTNHALRVRVLSPRNRWIACCLVPEREFGGLIGIGGLAFALR